MMEEDAVMIAPNEIQYMVFRAGVLTNSATEPTPKFTEHGASRAFEPSRGWG